MSGENGNGQHGKGDNGRDPVTGQFVKGWKGGPGQPPKPLGPTWRKMVREVAKARNVSPKELMIEVALELFSKALDEKDLKAIMAILEREIGPIARGPLVQVNQQTNHAHVEAKLPEGKEGKDYFRRFVEIVAEQGLIGIEGEDDT